PSRRPTASPAAKSSSRTPSIDHRPSSPPRVAVDPGGELVVDRLRHASVIFGPDAVAEDGDRRPDRLLVLELDGEGVHRDDPDHTPRLAADPHLSAGQVAAEAVRVAHGPEP